MRSSSRVLGCFVACPRPKPRVTDRVASRCRPAFPHASSRSLVGLSPFEGRVDRLVFRYPVVRERCSRGVSPVRDRTSSPTWFRRQAKPRLSLAGFVTSRTSLVRRSRAAQRRGRRSWPESPSLDPVRRTHRAASVLPREVGPVRPGAATSRRRTRKGPSARPSLELPCGGPGEASANLGPPRPAWQAGC